MSNASDWPTVKLGEVVEINPRLQTRPADDDNITFIPMTAVEEAGFISSKELRTYGEVKKGYTPFQKDDLLLAKITPCFQNKKISAADIDTEVGIGSTEFHVLRTSNAIDMKYLLHLLRQDSVVSEGEKCMTGSGGQRRVPRWFLENLSIPLPPLAEQQRIAEILDRSQSLMDDSIKMERKCDALLRAYFISRFGHPLDPANSIPRQAIGSISHVITGNTPPRKDPSNYGKSLEWLKSDNLGNLWPTSAAESLSSKGAEKARVVEEGAVLVTCIAGSRESIGKSSLLNRKAAFNQQINAIVPSASLEPFFLFAQIKAAPELIRRQATDGMKGIVSKKTLESVEILVPPLDLQRNFAAVVADIAGLKERAQQRINHFRNLYHSLSTRAFASQL